MSTAALMDSAPLTPLGIIAGGGALPRQLVESCLRSGREVFIVAVEGETDPETTENLPHVWIRFGSIGTAFDHLKRAGVVDLVMAGKMKRPSIVNVKPDMMSAKLLARLGLSLFGGDAPMFRTIISFLEEHGFRVIGVEDILQDLVAPEGPLGQNIPDKQAQKDIEFGARVARAVGALDVGQAVIVKNGIVLGIEAAEGTDALIERCAEFRGEGKGGVLVKARKPIQEERADLPTIGVQTVELVHRAGFSGIAIEARHSLVVGRRDVIRRADALGLFVIGFSLAE